MPEQINPPVVNCPTCGKPASVKIDNVFRPFCCERCKLIDLGEWASERRRIAGEPALSEEVLDPDHNG